MGSPLLRPADLLASLLETFTSRLPARWSPFAPLDMTTVATGRFHRQDFHLLEVQLASLHRKTRFRLVAHLGRTGFEPAGFQREVSALLCYVIASSSPRLGLAHMYRIS
jgi:hypothetical protein